MCAILFATGVAIFIWQLTIEKTVPLAGAGDILFFVSVMLTGVCALWCNRAMEAAAGGLLMAGFAALASWLNLKDPSLTPLMPVLHSPWLSVHVALVMTSYAFMAFTLPISFIAFALPSRRETLAKMSIDILMPGVYLLGLGIWAGAMWANISWGRYWAWDPKETWALVTMILYAIPLHRSVGLQRSPIALHVYLALAFLSIIMTYWGVNYLPSIHAYQ